jgi:hypothetical protein
MIAIIPAKIITDAPVKRSVSIPEKVNVIFITVAVSSGKYAKTAYAPLLFACS